MNDEELQKIHKVHTEINKTFAIGIFFILFFLIIFLVLNMHFVYTPDTFFLKTETKEKLGLKFTSTGEIIAKYAEQANVIDTLSLQRDSLGNVSEIYYDKFKEMFEYYQIENKRLEKENIILQEKLNKCK